MKPPQREPGPSVLRGRRVWWAAVGSVLLAGLSACTTGQPGGRATTDSRIGVTLVTQDAENPYDIALERGARRAVDQYGVRLTSASGDGAEDAATQVEAVDAAVARGDRGIVIDPADGPEVADAVTRARLAGLYVIALDARPDPADLVDVTFASDPREAGRLLGSWAAGRLGGRSATLAMLGAADPDTADATDEPTGSGDRERDQGFLSGMGIGVADPAVAGDESDTGSYGAGEGEGEYEIACRSSSEGTVDGGRLAMDECLVESDAVGVAFAADEPTALGAVAALDAAAETDTVVVAADASCVGVQAVQDGELGAVVQRHPADMAGLGVGAIAKIARGGVKPSTTKSLGFYDTGVELVTDRPVPGVPSTSSAQALRTCWG